MTKHLFIFFVIFLLSSCSLKNNDNEKLKNNIVQSVKTGNLNQVSMSNIDFNNIIFAEDEFCDKNNCINNMKIALNEGYLPLLEDISHNKYSCIKENSITGKYRFTDWETRNIGFANWPAHAKNELLLHKVKILKLQILVMKLSDEKELNSFIKQKQIDLNKTISELTAIAEENNFVD